MVVFGGYYYKNEVHVLDLNAWTWTQPSVSGTNPTARSSHSAAVFGSKMIVFGGDAGSTRLSDVHVLDLNAWTWTQPSVSGTNPMARSSHSAIVDNAKMVVFGGYTGSSNLNDVHVLDLCSPSCLACDAGTWSLANATRWTNCLAGTFSVSESEGCTSCTAGKWSSDASGECATCDAGTWSLANATLCTNCLAGTSSASESEVCTTCTAGKWSAEASGVCATCPTGTWSLANATQCTNCLAGTSSTAESGSCTTCTAGKWNAEASGVCAICDAGKWSLANATQCTNCLAGTSSTAESEGCTACTAGKWSAEASGNCTTCDAGKWSLANASQCTNCLAGTFSALAGASSPCTPCTLGTYAPAASAIECTACPTDRTTLKQRTATATDCECLAGNYDITQGNCQPCPHKPACLGGIRCAPGYDGILCGTCAKGRYKWESRCLVCPNWMWPTLMALCFLFSAALLLYYLGLDKNKITLLKLATHFLQITAFAALIAVAWPAAVVQLMDLISVIGAGIEIFHPECFGENWSSHDRLGMTMLMTGCCLAALFGVDRWTARKQRALDVRKSAGTFRGTDADADAKVRTRAHGIRALTVLFITLAYAPLIKLSMAVFHCVEAVSEEWVLRDNTSVSCMGGEHDAAVAGAILCLVVVGVGLPVWIAWKMCAIDLHDGDMIETYGALYTLYRDDVPWFDATMMVRKLVMLGFLAIFVTDAVAQAITQIVVSVLYGAMVLKLRPFRPRLAVLWCTNYIIHDLYNSLEFLGSCVHAFNYLLALLLATSVGGAEAMGVLCIVSNGVMVGLIITRFQQHVVPKGRRITADNEKGKAIQLKKVAPGFTAPPMERNYLFRTKEDKRVYKRWIKGVESMHKYCRTGQFEAAQQEQREVDDCRDLIMKKIEHELLNTNEDKRVEGFVALKEKVVRPQGNPLRMRQRLDNANEAFQDRLVELRRDRESALKQFEFLEAKEAHEDVSECIDAHVRKLQPMLVNAVECELLDVAEHIFKSLGDATKEQKQGGGAENAQPKSVYTRLKKQLAKLEVQLSAANPVEKEATLPELEARASQYKKYKQQCQDVVDDFVAQKPQCEGAHKYDELKAVWERVLAVLEGSWQRNGKATKFKLSYSAESIPNMFLRWYAGQTATPY